MHCEAVAYRADNLNMMGALYSDEKRADRRPGVLVFPEAFGLGDHAKERAKRLADLGYVALACDLHGDAAIIDDIDTVMPRIRELRQKPDHTRARAAGALEALARQPMVDASRIAAIGFCFGGTMALELARSGADIRGVVGFHSGLMTVKPEDAKNIRGKILVCVGADDPSIPREQRAAFEQEMRAGKVDWRMHLYGGVVHSFTEPAADSRGRLDSMRYDAGADARSWAEMRAFFDEIFA